MIICLLEGPNAPGRILAAVAEAFDTDIVSEHEPQYWGFETREEWHADMEQLAKEAEDEFYEDLLCYVRREKHDLSPGTVGMTKAEIGEKLIAERPELASPDKKRQLLDAIEEVYERDHTVTITLNNADLAAARMAVTHEDDLPQA